MNRIYISNEYPLPKKLEFLGDVKKFKVTGDIPKGVNLSNFHLRLRCPYLWSEHLIIEDKFPVKLVK